jgi:hypothetical protein
VSTPFTSCLGLYCAVFFFEGEDCNNCGNNCNKELRKEKSEEQRATSAGVIMLMTNKEAIAGATWCSAGVQRYCST